MIRVLVFLFALLIGSACTPEPPTEAGSAPNAEGEVVVYATEYPVAYFAERLTSGLGRVVCPVPEDADPIHWQPSRDVVEDFRAATLVVSNGAGFARWIENASLPESRLVRTADDFEAEFLHYEEQTHSHGPGGTHTHSGIDPHTWLDPLNARRQSDAIAGALLARLPEHREVLEANLASLHADLEALEAEWRQLFESMEGVTLVANHPAYDYLLRRFGWSATNLDLDPDASVSDAGLAQVEQAFGGAAKRVLLWESEPLPETRKRLGEEIDVQCVVVPPAEVLSAQERQNGDDYLTLQRAAIVRLRETLD